MHLNSGTIENINNNLYFECRSHQSTTRGRVLNPFRSICISTIFVFRSHNTPRSSGGREGRTYQHFGPGLLTFLSLTFLLRSISIYFYYIRFLNRRL